VDDVPDVGGGRRPGGGNEFDADDDHDRRKGRHPDRRHDHHLDLDDLDHERDDVDLDLVDDVRTVDPDDDGAHHVGADHDLGRPPDGHAVPDGATATADHAGHGQRRPRPGLTGATSTVRTVGAVRPPPMRPRRSGSFDRHLRETDVAPGVARMGVESLPTRRSRSEEYRMKLSTRNQLPATVQSVTAGDAMAVVKVALAGGDVVTASITREAAEDLALTPGQPVTVLVKSTQVMLAVE